MRQFLFKYLFIFQQKTSARHSLQTLSQKIKVIYKHSPKSGNFGEQGEF